MKDSQNWTSLFAAIVYMLFKAITAMQKRAYKLPYPVNESVKIDEEKKSNSRSFSKSMLHLDNVREHSKKRVKKRLSPISLSFKKDPLYPGLKNLLMPTQQKGPHYPGLSNLLMPTEEKDVHNLYPVNSSAPNNKLNRILGKYSASKKLLIIAEMLQPRSGL